MHMHELELQVMYDKHLHLELVREKKAIEEENQLLKQILDHHGIAYPIKNKPDDGVLQPTQNFNFANGTNSISTAFTASTPFSLSEPSKTKALGSDLLLAQNFNFADTLNPTPISQNPPLSLLEPAPFNPDIEGDLQIIQIQDGILDYVEVSLNFVLKSVLELYRHTESDQNPVRTC